MNTKAQYRKAYSLARKYVDIPESRYREICISGGIQCAFEAWESFAMKRESDPIGAKYRREKFDAETFKESPHAEMFHTLMAFQYRSTRKEFYKLAAFETLIRQQKSVEDRILAVLGK